MLSLFDDDRSDIVIIILVLSDGLVKTILQLEGVITSSILSAFICEGKY